MFKDGKLDANAAMQLLAARADENHARPAVANPERASKRRRSPSPEEIPSDDEPKNGETNAGQPSTLEPLSKICLLVSHVLNIKSVECSC